MFKLLRSITSFINRNDLITSNERIISDEDYRLTPDEIVKLIRMHVSSFNGSGMIIVIQQYYRIEIFILDGISICNWGYNNGVFSVEPPAQRFLKSSSITIKLKIGYAEGFVQTLKNTFTNNDVSVGKLWKLDPDAWDYETMKILHEYDFAIRVSFN